MFQRRFLIWVVVTLAKWCRQTPCKGHVRCQLNHSKTQQKLCLWKTRLAGVRTLIVEVNSMQTNGTSETKWFLEIEAMIGNQSNFLPSEYCGKEAAYPWLVSATVVSPDAGEATLVKKFDVKYFVSVQWRLRDL